MARVFLRPLVAPMLAAMLASACVTLPREDAPPPTADAAPIGFPPGIRSQGVDQRSFEASFGQSLKRVSARAGDGGMNLLALSGGGAGGAFGAGVLVGLTRAGARPDYDVVTGVSTGALIAPFAFLGSAWDGALTDAYLGDRTSTLLKLRGIGVLFRPGLYEGVPLSTLVDHFVTREMISAVAKEAAAGRLLLVATTNLDKQETEIWDMGAIALVGGEKARTLFRDVLIASSSVPGVFPPVMIDVRKNGVAYQEMHVDGGATIPFFIAPEAAFVSPDRLAGLNGAHLHVIVNGQLSASPVSTPINTLPIVSRGFASMLAHMARTALALTAGFAERQKAAFNFTEIPYDYPFQGPLDFDRRRMKALFEFGAICAEQGRLWLSAEDAVASAGGGQPQNPQSSRCPRDAPRPPPKKPETAAPPVN